MNKDFIFGNSLSISAIGLEFNYESKIAFIHFILEKKSLIGISLKDFKNDHINKKIDTFCLK